MNKLKLQPKHIAEAINKCPYNLKAEIIAALVSEMSETQLQANYTSSFNRPYKKDLHQVLYNNKKNEFNLLISRNGLYDMLPEGLFHQEKVTNDQNTSISTLISSYKKQKKEETDARLFFTPFENYLFQFLIQIEKKEKCLLNNSRKFQHFYKKFWDIPSWVKDEEFSFLLRILPYNNQIKGNLKKITQQLSRHLKKNISHEKSWIEIPLPTPHKNQSLILGKNFIIGNTTDKLPLVELIIYEVTDEELAKYSANGYYYKFIKLCLDYFFTCRI